MAVISFKCPNCEGELIFDPSSQNYKCEYCGSAFTQAQLDAMNGEEQLSSEEQEAFSEEYEEAYTEGAVHTEGADPTATMLYTCPSCGAEIVTDATTAATFCFYCHNPVVLSGRLDGKYLPDRIIPFQIDEKRAKSEFLSFVKKKKYVPGEFFKEEQIEKLSGVYFPYWICDCDRKVDYDAKAKKLRIWRAGDVEYTETKEYVIERKGTVHFENLTKEALKKADRILVEGVQPFRLEEMKPFQMSYLSGFQAEKRDMESQEFVKDLDQETNRYTQKLVSSTVSGYNAVTSSSLNGKILDMDWKYLLVPVWLLTYKKEDSDRIYYFAMNGQTGKVVGDLPISMQKLLLHSGVIGLVVFILFLIGGYMI